MRETENSASPSHLGGTLVALCLAPVVFVIFGGVLGAIYALVQVYFTDTPRWWITMGVGVVQAVAGTVGAKAACDAVLRSYSGRAIFVEFVALAGVLVFANFYLVPVSITHLSLLIQFACLAWISWLGFWKGESL